MSWLGKLATLLIAFVISGAVAFAQTKTVSGTVIDDFGEPVIGANVISSSTNGTITDVDGNFKLSNVPENGSLTISFIGYATQTVSVAGQSVIKVALKEEGEDLEEVVVVGYGVQKKKDLTGSVASVKAGDLQKVAAANPMQAMQAKVPGVDLSASDGQAGAGVSIQLRGSRSILASNSPLVLVDGVEYGSTIDIPASDIESMDILKDAASTAIYGTKGANGVIIITTKRGSKDAKTKVNVNAYLSINNATGITSPMYGKKEVQRLIDAADYKAAAGNNWDFNTAHNTAEGLLGGAVHAYSGLNIYNDVIANDSYTDWMDHILQTGYTQNYEVSINGGGKKTNFSVGASLMDDAGMMKNDEYKRYTIRANVDHEVNKMVKIGTSLSYAYKNNDKRNSGVYNLAQKMTSITHAYDAEGNIIKKPSYFYDAHANPLLDEIDGAYQRNIITSRFFGSAYAQLTPVKGLTIKSNFTLDRQNVRDGLYQDFESVGRFQTPTTSYISNGREDKTKFVWQNTANYLVPMESKHSLTLLLGHEMTQSIDEATSIAGDAGAEHFYNSSFYDLSKIATPDTKSSYVKTSMVSGFARANYSYAGKYLLQASVRADGSSVLAEGKKWGVFPSVSAGWRLIDEKFMEGAQEWMDNLKLRASWGLSGNAAIDAYQTLATVNTIVPSSTYKAPMSMANPDLTWEKTSAINFGLDFGFLNNRIGGSIEYYITNTFDLLYFMTAPASSVYTSTLSNIGETKGHGFEMSLNANPLRTDDFSWTLDASLTLARDEVKKLRDGVDEVITGNQILRVGEPISAYYQYEVDGCWNIGEFDKYLAEHPDFEKPFAEYGNPGTSKAIDQNNDGKIDDGDKIVYNRAPKAIVGLTNTFAYKNFTLSVQAMARLGGYMDYNGYALFTYDNSNWGDLDYWTPNNTGALIPSPGIEKNGAFFQSAIKMQKADYFKIKDITLSYDFDKSLLNKALISNARVYCSLKNFITASHIDGYDSERGGSVTFPLSKQVVVGLNLTF